MRFGDALKEAIKYHAIAIVPTLIGAVIVLVSLWIGILDPLLGAIAGELGEPTVALERAFEADYSLGLAVVGVIAGLLIRRIGRTAILFRTHGNAVVEEVDNEVIPEALVNAPGSAAADPSADPSGGPSDRYATDTSDADEREEPAETTAYGGEETASDAIGEDETDDGDDAYGGDDHDDAAAASGDAEEDIEHDADEEPTVDEDAEGDDVDEDVDGDEDVDDETLADGPSGDDVDDDLGSRDR